MGLGRKEGAIVKVLGGKTVGCRASFHLGDADADAGRISIAALGLVQLNC